MDDRVDKYYCGIVFGEYIYLKDITNDKYINVFCWSCPIMTTFWSCHLIVNDNCFGVHVNSYGPMFMVQLLQLGYSLFKCVSVH